jgi:hypothetical protein
MTDTFPSGSSAPLGGAQRDSQPAGDVTSALAELERKLRELERELTSIGHARVRPEETAAKAPATGAPAGTGRLIDEQLETVQPAPAPVEAAIEWATPAERATPVGQVAAREHPASPGDAQQLAGTGHPQPMSPSDAQPAGAGDVPPMSPSDAQLASLAELRRFRDRVERFAKELTEDYDAMLGRVMAGLSGRGSSEPSYGLGEPPATLTADTRAPTPPEPGPEETVFQGRVELGVGPFYDIGSLGAFEQSLAALPCVSHVAVRRFEASHAVVDLRLAAPVALVSELRRALHSDFSIREVAEGRMLLTFEDS